MGRNAPTALRIAPPDADLAWLGNHWNDLPPEVKMTIMTIIRNVLPQRS